MVEEKKEEKDFLKSINSIRSAFDSDVKITLLVTKKGIHIIGSETVRSYSDFVDDVDDSGFVFDNDVDDDVIKVRTNLNHIDYVG